MKKGLIYWAVLCLAFSFLFILSACGGRNEGNPINMTVNVKSDYGAYGDGLHDDTAAIQKALDDCRKTGGTIVVPDGVYLISSCLIIYSNQTLILGENTTVKRNSDVKYMLAVYTQWKYGRYNGTHNVTVKGGIWDGNENIKDKLTILNTCHAKDIVFDGCSFKNGNAWHYIEINSSKNVTVKNCVFDGRTVHDKRQDGLSELIQLDKALRGYGPVFRNGKKMKYLNDNTACKNIIIENNTFYCDGTPALGNHKTALHKDIVFRNNTVYGTASINDTARGYIVFKRYAKGIEVYNNEFHAEDVATNIPNVAITVNSKIKSSCRVYNNTFYGTFTAYFIGGITASGNTFEN